MTTFAILAAGFVAGYLAGGVMGFWIGVEHNEAPVMSDPVRPAIVDMEYMDAVSGRYLESSTSIYIEERPDGSSKHYIIQNN